ncbi:alpha/beta hydrolase family protein [Nocardia inohanensis]|uniref:alpha/beta hydrolase family protein n=1 Tax=Nocardia inohanensis TaxID=209246 RepID=UPI00082CDF78|nr:alpha/beta hydrolase family protein [Nocardia inohanensis]
MAFQWKLDPAELFVERYPQMVNTGLPVADVDAVRAAITAMWPDEPGGWVHEWSRLGARYAEAGRHDAAVSAYGWARFPTLADDAKHVAFQRQLEQYQLAAAEFPVSFERRVLHLPHAGSTTPVPVHLLGAHDRPDPAPVLLVSGGVDSWKMDLHNLFASLAVRTGALVVAFDIPGTGESQLPLDVTSAELVDELVAAARELGNGRVVHFGISMGGYFSARTGLSGHADAAVVLGGPVEAAFAPDRGWAFGMAGIVGNAMGFDAVPEPAEMSERMAAMTLRPLLDLDTGSPMLIVNGADDVHIPATDTLVFEGRRATEVHLMPDTGHCAISKLPAALDIIVPWLQRNLRD